MNIPLGVFLVPLNLDYNNNDNLFVFFIACDILPDKCDSFLLLLLSLIILIEYFLYWFLLLFTLE